MEIPQGKMKYNSEYGESVFDTFALFTFSAGLQEARHYLFRKINSETIRQANGIKLVWFGLVYRRLPEQKVPNLHFSLMCSISSFEVPTPFEGGARATELKSSGALVERPLKIGYRIVVNVIL